MPAPINSKRTVTQGSGQFMYSAARRVSISVILPGIENKLACEESCPLADRNMGNSSISVCDYRAMAYVRLGIVPQH